MAPKTARLLIAQVLMELTALTQSAHQIKHRIQLTQTNVQQTVPLTALMLIVLELTVPGLGAIQHVVLILSVEPLTALRETVLDQIALSPIALQMLQLYQLRQIQQTLH